MAYMEKEPVPVRALALQVTGDTLFLPVKMQIHLVMKNLITILAFLAGFTFSANSQDIEKQAPAGFDSVRAGIPHGKIDTIKYYRGGFRVHPIIKLTGF